MNNKSNFHQNPALWMLIIIPATAVIAGITLLIISIIYYDGLVVDDYYKKGKEINRTLRRDVIADQFQLSAKVNLNQASEQLTVELKGNNDFLYPQTITTKFLHRTLSGRDIDLTLQHNSNGQYSATMPSITPSRWLIELGTQHWRLTGQAILPEENVFSLNTSSLK